MSTMHQIDRRIWLDAVRRHMVMCSSLVVRLGGIKVEERRMDRFSVEMISWTSSNLLLFVLLCAILSVFVHRPFRLHRSGLSGRTRPLSRWFTLLVGLCF